MHGAQSVLGILALFKPPASPDFDLRQVRLIELLARRVAYILMNAYDPTTGLLTRSAFEKRVQSLLAAATPQSNHCVIYVDIDRLHVLNENLGMHVGDEVIVRVADVIRRQPRRRACSRRASRATASRSLSATRRSTRRRTLPRTCGTGLERLDFVNGTQTVDVSASFGVARVVESKHPLSHALAAAEIACKAAKDRGRDRVETTRTATRASCVATRTSTLVGTLRRALAEDRFRLEAQPIVPLNGAVSGPKFELLLRMTDEAGDSVSPEKFLSAAERYQLAPAIDRWVVRRVLATLGERTDDLVRLGACFAVNISGQSLGDQDFCAFLEGGTAPERTAGPAAHVRADRDRRRCEHRPRRVADPPAARTGLRRGAG